MRGSSFRSVLLSTLLLGALALSRGAFAQVPPPPIVNDPILADDLKPTTDGPGPGICEPVTKNAPPALADFGTGCARWLQFALGANVTLGQTPPWDAQVRGRKELGTLDLRLTAAQAEHFAEIVGYTHLAVGEISGTPEHCVLTYQLLEMPHRTSLGTPLKATGSEAQVVAALPEMARQLLTLMKVAKPQLPSGALPSPAALQSIGSYAWYPDAAVPEADRKKMEALAAQQPLAGLLLVLHAPDPTTNGAASLLEARCKLLFAQAPGNMMVLSAFTRVWPGLSDPLRLSIDRHMPDRPRNATVSAWRLANSHPFLAEISQIQENINRAEQTVRCSPRNPSSWVMAARVYMDVAQQMLRQRRLATQADTLNIQAFYNHVISMARRATELDPTYGRAWTELSRAATPLGNYDLGASAMDQAKRYDQGDLALYNWGIQLYSQIYLNNRDKQVEMAHLALADSALILDDAYAISTTLRGFGMTAEAKAMLDHTLQGYRDAALKQPESSTAHQALGFRLYQEKQYPEAETEEKTAIRLDPNDAEAHFVLGIVYANTERREDAITEYRLALKSAPNWGMPQFELGRGLWVLHHDKEAEVELRKSLVSNPDGYFILFELGDICLHQKRYAEGIVFGEKAASVAPISPEAQRMLCELYNGVHQYAKAVQAGEQAIGFEPKVYLNEVSLADAYFGNAQYKESLDHYTKAVNITKKDPRALTGIGKSEIKAGNKLGPEQLKMVIRLYPDTPSAADAKQFLMENPDAH